MKPQLLVQGALRVEYRVELRSLEPSTSLIESETRLAGGNGAVSALALAQLGARVRLSGKVGDDSHGRFLLSLLENVPDLELDVRVEKMVTPYAILIRGEDGATQTLLSPEAARLEGAQDYAALLDSLRAALEQFIEDQQQVEELVAGYDESFGNLGSLQLEKMKAETRSVR